MPLLYREEGWKCQPVKTQNIEKVNIVQHAAVIHSAIRSPIFHLMTKIIMRTENGTTLIHLYDKRNNQNGCIHAPSILFLLFLSLSSWPPSPVTGDVGEESLDFSNL